MPDTDSPAGEAPDDRAHAWRVWEIACTCGFVGTDDDPPDECPGCGAEVEVHQ